MTPLFIGIAGGTGSGKSTVARKIAEGLPAASVSTVDYDSYYRDRSNLTVEERARINFDHPDSLDTELLMRHLGQLKNGQAIEVPVYDFRTHARLAETTRVEPTRIVIVEGILVFVEEQVRRMLDVRVFVDTDADIRVFRRIRRDLEQRGRTFQSIREQYYKTVRPMHIQFVEPSKRWADVIVPEGGENLIAIDLILGKLRHVLAQQSEPAA